MCSRSVLGVPRTWKRSAGAGFGDFPPNSQGGTLIRSHTHTRAQKKNFWDIDRENIYFFIYILSKPSIHAAFHVLEMFPKRPRTARTETGTLRGVYDCHCLGYDLL